MNADNWFAKGLNRLQAGAFLDVLDAFTTTIQRDPEFAEAYAYRGFAHYHLGNHDAAMADYDKAIAMWPTRAEIYYFRGTLHGQLKNHEKAISDFTMVIELKPALIEAFYFRAINHGAAGRYEEALRDMKTAAELGYEPAKEFLESHRVTPKWN